VEKLKDIKDIVDVVDYSLYYLVGSISFLLILLILTILFFRRPKRKRKITQKEVSLQNLQNINYDDDKDIAYIFTLNIDEFINDTNKEEINNILNKLKEYKYKKYISKINNDLKQDIKNIIGRIK